MTCSMLSPSIATVEVTQYSRNAGACKAGKRTAAPGAVARDTTPPSGRDGGAAAQIVAAALGAPQRAGREAGLAGRSRAAGTNRLALQGERGRGRPPVGVLSLSAHACPARYHRLHRPASALRAPGAPKRRAIWAAASCEC